MHGDVPGFMEYVSWMDEPAFVNQYPAGSDVEARETALPIAMGHDCTSMPIERTNSTSLITRGSENINDFLWSQ
jgi:hypothetical protein